MKQLACTRYSSQSALTMPGPNVIFMFGTIVPRREKSFLNKFTNTKKGGNKTCHRDRIARLTAPYPSHKNFNAYFSIKTYVVTPHQNFIPEMGLMGSHNMFLEIKKIS